MTDEQIKKYYKTITDTWKIFHMLLTNFQPTEEYMQSCVKWLSDIAGSDDFFATNIGKVCLAELFRLIHQESAGIDLLMLVNAAYSVSENYGVKVKIKIKDKDGTERELETEGGNDALQTEKA